jgi:branched-chain amino acid transport system permease protein
MSKALKKWFVILPTGIALSMLLADAVDPYTLHLLILCSLFSMVALAQDVAFGRSGQLLICAGAFFAIGAYTSAIIALRIGAPFGTCLLAATLSASLAGYGIGWAATRVSGHYLAILSIAFSVIVHQVLLNWSSLTNGAQGLNNIPRPASFVFLDFSSKSTFFVVCIFALLTTIAAIHLISATRLGAGFAAIREDELAAQSLGISIRRVKISAIVISGAISGAAGSLYAHYQGLIAPEDFTFSQSVNSLMMVIIGGANTIVGPILGAILMTLLPEYLRAMAEYRWVIFGICIIVFTAILPSGIWGLVRLTYGKTRDFALKKRTAAG